MGIPPFMEIHKWLKRLWLKILVKLTLGDHRFFSLPTFRMNHPMIGVPSEWTHTQILLDDHQWILVISGY